MEEERKNFIYGVEDEEGNIDVPGCVRNGISEKAANKIYDSMMDFASYAFNKSHAAAYAVIAYQTAYLVCYYPTEYMAAMLNSVRGNSDKVALYIRAAKDMNIELLQPDINESYAKFTAKENKIRFGLAAIKNVGDNIIENIVQTRNQKGKFKDFADFCNKVDSKYINKRVIESLIKAGALDCFCVYRSQLLAIYEKIIDSVISSRKKNIDGQMSLFAGFEEQFKHVEIKYPDIREFDKKYLLAMEKEMTGLYLTGHPLEDYEQMLNNMTSIKTIEILGEDILEEEIMDDAAKQVEEQNSSVKDGQKVILGGIISEVTKKITRTNSLMAFIKVEDLYGTIEVIVFPKILERFSETINEDEIVLIKGRVTKREDEQAKVICDTVERLIKVSNKKLYILIDSNDEVIKVKNDLKSKLLKNPGNVPVFLCTRKERKKYMMDREFWVQEEEELLNYLTDKFGKENVKVL